jgi:hypothetical protein
MENRIELYERYEKGGEYSREWWEDNMPDGSVYNPSYNYRRTNPRVDDIERIIEIVGDKQECVVKFYWGEQMYVKANFDELCIVFNDLCNAQTEGDEWEIVEI